MADNLIQKNSLPSIMGKRRTERRPFLCPVLFDWTARDTNLLGMVRCRGTVVNIHTSGLGLVSNQFVMPGDVIKVYLPVEGVRIPLPTFSEVRWSISSENQTRAGLQFLS